MFIQSSQAHNIGDTAELVSSLIKTPGQLGCSFRFYYRMKGTNIGPLTVSSQPVISDISTAFYFYVTVEIMLSLSLTVCICIICVCLSYQ